MKDILVMYLNLWFVLGWYCNENIMSCFGCFMRFIGLWGLIRWLWNVWGIKMNKYLKLNECVNGLGYNELYVVEEKISYYKLICKNKYLVIYECMKLCWGMKCDVGGRNFWLDNWLIRV